jgi:hypothetical protein
MKRSTHGRIGAARPCLGARHAWPVDGASPRLVPSTSATHRRHGLGGQRPRLGNMEMEPLGRILVHLSLSSHVPGQTATGGAKELSKVKVSNEHHFFA